MNSKKNSDRNLLGRQRITFCTEKVKIKSSSNKEIHQ